MRAIKGNKVYQIKEEQKKFYTDSGFDIQDDNGNVIAHGRGKAVPYDEYVKLQKENAELRAKLAESEVLKAEEVTEQEDTPAKPGKGTGKKAGE